MWITQPSLTRAIVWLAAIAIPFQGVPASACNCTSAIVSCDSATTDSVDCCSDKEATAQQEASGCCEQSSGDQCPCTDASICHCGELHISEPQEPSCCSSEDSLNSVCSCSAGCQCGDDCHCGDSEETPTAPTAPPAEENSSERILADSVETISFVFTEILAETLQRPVSYEGILPSSALDSCVALCRFTL